MIESPIPLRIVPNPAPASDAERAALLANPGFGRVFSDHMMTAQWTPDQGWGNAEIGALRPFQLHPAAAVLHYAQEIFEGMKAYRAADGRALLFRPDRNAARFTASAERMAMPSVPEDLFVAAVKALVDIDRAWIPDGDASLYLRPFMIASEAFLGGRPAQHYIFSVIASPVVSYFKGGAAGITVRVADEATRAAPMGTGAAKCGGNYAAGLLASAESGRQGCDQTVFLDAVERKWIEELGGMNLFFVFDDKRIVTPPLGGTILPGITRASIITLARDSGFTVEERPISIDEWREGAESARLVEAFACGTAAVVAGIGAVRWTHGDFTIGGDQAGPVTIALRDELTGIQRGEIADRHGWVVTV